MRECYSTKIATRCPTIVYDTRESAIANLYGVGTVGSAYASGSSTVLNVTHWMPLPDPPTEAKT